MSATNPRDPKFTARLERALTHLTRGSKNVLAVAQACSVPSLDLFLWLNTFNDGRPQLTVARIEQVKREVGVIVERRVTPEERAEIEARKTKRQADEAVAAAAKAAAEADRASRIAYQKRERQKRLDKRPERTKPKPVAGVIVTDFGKFETHAPINSATPEWVARKGVTRPVAETEVHRSLLTPGLPWRKVGTGWVIKSVATWRAQLEDIARGQAVGVVLASLDREAKVAFCTFRLRYFGVPAQLTADAAADLLAFVQKVDDARVAVTTPRVRSREAAEPVAMSPAVADALEAARNALANLERAILAERRAA